MRRIAAVLTMLAVCALAHAAGYEGNSLLARVEPDTAFLTGQVTVSGSSGAFQDNTTVTAEFTPPSGQAFTRTTQLTEDGTFELVSGSLGEAGEWTVAVTGPLSELTDEAATIPFEVHQPAAVAAVSIRAFTDGTEQMADFLAVTEEQIDLYTEVPHKDEARQQVNDLQQDIQRLEQGLNELADSLDEISEAMEHMQAFPEMQEAMVSLATEIQGPLAEMQAASRKLTYTHETANNAREWCRTWHAQKEGMKILKDMVLTIAGGTKAISGWVTGKLTGAVQSARNKLIAGNIGATEEQIGIIENNLGTIDKARQRIKEASDPGGSLGGWMTEIISGRLDRLIDWIASSVAPNCGMYEADVTGKLYVEYYTKKMVYMVAKYDWKGKMELFFQKRQSEMDVVQLKGQIWGSFGWQTGEFYPERTAMDIPGVTGVGLCIPRPPFVDYRDFYLSLEGEGKPHGLELWVTETGYDIPRIPYGFISVLWSPYQVVPAVDFPEMDVPGGEWFVTRVTGLSQPDVDRFFVPLVVEDDKVLLKDNLERTLDYRDRGEFRAFLKMKIDGKEGSL